MEAAKYLKPCVLELGGKAPAVVRASLCISRCDINTDEMIGIGS